MTEQELIMLARQGDRDAYEHVVIRPLERQIYSFCYRMLGGDADEAADVTQDVFVKGYIAIPRVNEDVNLSAWMHRIAQNGCLDILRRRQRKRFIPWEGPKHDHMLISAPSADPERRVISAETGVMVRRVLARMSDRHRLGIEMREFSEASCQEIADYLGISRSATKSMLFRAREEFRRIYAQLTIEDEARTLTLYAPRPTATLATPAQVVRCEHMTGRGDRVIGGDDVEETAALSDAQRAGAGRDRVVAGGGRASDARRPVADWVYQSRDRADRAAAAGDATVVERPAARDTVADHAGGLRGGGRPGAVAADVPPAGGVARSAADGAVAAGADRPIPKAPATIVPRSDQAVAAIRQRLSAAYFVNGRWAIDDVQRMRCALALDKLPELLDIWWLPGRGVMLDDGDRWILFGVQPGRKSPKLDERQIIAAHDYRYELEMRPHATD